MPSPQAIPGFSSRLHAQSLAEHFCMLVSRVFGGLNLSEHAPFLNSRLGRPCWVILSLTLVWWAACRLSRKSENTRLLPNASRYDIIKRESTFNSELQAKNHSDIVIIKKTTNPGCAAIMRFLNNVFIGLLGLYSLANALNGNTKHASPRSFAANSSSVLDVFQVYKPVEFDPPSQGCNEVLLLMEHEFAASYGKPFVGTYGCFFVVSSHV